MDTSFCFRPFGKMNRFVFTCIILSASAMKSAPSIANVQNNFSVKTHTLSNGMEVWVNEDPNYPMVYGAVAVKAGAKDCPNTGIAHYFEHIMFKGTDRIGTLDYSKEKTLLDSIEAAYSELKKTPDPVQRKTIQKRINALSMEAARYAIPNEFIQLLSDFGGSKVNAFTSYDLTAYFNYLTPQYLEPWMQIYSDRFIHPVFRLFQSELETVYEEKNMYSDNFGQSLMERALHDFFEPHPYAYPVIGSSEHLKNPDLQQMHTFFKQYYVAGNMALIVSGDVKADEVFRLAEHYFGRLPKGTKPQQAVAEVRSWSGTQQRSLLAPIPVIRARAQAWRTVPKNHPDEAAIAVAMRLMSNSNGTGFLDVLTQERRLMAAIGIAVDQFNDMGVAATVAIPKMAFQTQRGADALVRQALQKLKTGDFEEEVFQSAKLEYLKERVQSLEDPKDRGLSMMLIFSGGNTWEKYVANQKAISSLTKADLVRVANTYFGDNKMVFTKKTGSYPKDKVEKPDFAPIVPPNKEAASEYATELRTRFAKAPEFRFVDLKEGAETFVLTDGTVLLKGNNPYNGIFSLTLRYDYGSFHDPLVQDLPVYLSMLGTDSSNYKAFQNKLRSFGANLSFSAQERSFLVHLTGFDTYFAQTVDLLERFMHSAAPDKKSMASLKDAKSMEAKANAKNNAFKADAMADYLVYGKNAPALRWLSRSEIGKRTDRDFMQLFEQIQARKAQIFYVGTLAGEEVKMRMQAAKLTQAAAANPTETFPMNLLDKPCVGVMHDPQARQSIIQVTAVTLQLETERDRILAQLLNDYLGGSMNSLLFQEIREFRSLAYRAGSSIQLPPKKAMEKRAVFNVLLSTQTDKTHEALEVLFRILDAPEFNQTRFDRAKLERMNKLAAGYPSFRDLPEAIAEAREAGYTEDPAKQVKEILQTLTLDDLRLFYQQKIVSQTRAISIYSNQKSLDIKALEKWGAVQFMKPKTVMKL